MNGETHNPLENPTRHYNQDLTDSLRRVRAAQVKLEQNKARTGNKKEDLNTEKVFLESRVAPLPTGWTYLIHGTDTVRWDTTQNTLEVNGLGLSAITKEQALRDAAGTTKNYSKPTTEGALALEIRIPFYREDLSRRRGAAEDVTPLKNQLDETTLNLITKYHQDRHPVVPRGEILNKIGEERAADGHAIMYFVPQSVDEQYRSSVDKM